MVALLGDAIVHDAAVLTDWPKPDKPLADAQVKKLQAKLKTLGYDVGEIDGKAGDAFRSAVRSWQERNGLTPDGYADVALLKRVTAQKVVAQK